MDVFKTLVHFARYVRGIFDKSTTTIKRGVLSVEFPEDILPNEKEEIKEGNACTCKYPIGSHTGRAKRSF